MEVQIGETRVGNVLAGWNHLPTVGPVQVRDARGARIQLASGDWCDDYIMGWGSCFLGHAAVDEVLHISANVSYALHKYCIVTGDDAYMAERGGEIAMASARFSASAFTWSDDKQAYVINRVMGPDEYHFHVDNSFYTNYLLGWCMEFALSLVDRGMIREFDAGELRSWRSIVKRVYLPWMDVDGVSIPEQFDGYAKLAATSLRVTKESGPRFVSEAERSCAQRLENFSTQTIKQADVVLLLSSFPDSFTQEVKRAALAFYEPRTVHESSLSYGPHAVVAADVGQPSVCADFITRASRYNLDFTLIEDYGNGVHLSAYAGAWQGLVEGMAGLRVEGEGLCFRPRLPAHWFSYRFAICFRGRRLLVTVPADGAVRVEHDGRTLPAEYRSDGRVYFCGALA